MDSGEYAPALHPTPMGKNDHCWVVKGPGLAGLQGTVPEHSQDMDLPSARKLADLLNSARRFGKRQAQTEMRHALGMHAP